MAAADYTYAFNSLNFGDSTNILVKEVRGLEDAVIDINSTPFARAHGGVPNEGYIIPRVFEMELEAANTSATALETAVDDIVEAFAGGQTTSEKPLVFKHPGTGQRRINSRCKTLTIAPRNITTDMGFVRPMTARFLASDPVVYDNTSTEVTVSVFSGSGGGVSYPVTYPKVYTAGGAGGAEVTVTNSGDWFSWATFSVAASGGDVATPTIEDVTHGLELAFTANGGATVADGQTLTVLTHPLTRSAKIGSASRIGKLSAGSTWFAVPPGATKFRFRATGDTSSGVLTITMRNAWMRG